MAPLLLQPYIRLLKRYMSMQLCTRLSQHVAKSWYIAHPAAIARAGTLQWAAMMATTNQPECCRCRPEVAKAWAWPNAHPRYTLFSASACGVTKSHHSHLPPQLLLL